MAITPKRTKQYEKAIRDVAKYSCGPNWPRDARYSVRVKFFLSANRGDIDNYEKCVLDSCNKILWLDDKQVDSITANKYVDKANPRTEITVETVGEV